MTDNIIYQPLIPFPSVKKHRREVKYSLENLPPNEALTSPPPSRSFIEDLDRRGQINKIVVARTHKGAFVIDGNRRIKAARVLGWNTILGDEIDMPLREAMLAKAAANNQSSSNDLSDIAAIRYVLDEIPEADNATLSKLTGINQGRVRSLRKTAEAPKELIEAVKEGTVAVGTLKEVAKQSPDNQQKAVEIFKENKAERAKKDDNGDKPVQKTFLTKEAVIDLQRVTVKETTAQIPIPEFKPVVAVQETLLGYAVMDNSLKVISPVTNLPTTQENYDKAAETEGTERLKIVKVYSLGE